jgi:hypothetical protein
MKHNVIRYSMIVLLIGNHRLQHGWNRESHDISRIYRRHYCVERRRLRLGSPVDMKIVAAADGRIRFIDDSFSYQAEWRSALKCGTLTRAAPGYTDGGAAHSTAIWRK